MNKWMGSGRISENPVIRYNRAGKPFITFSLMCRREKKIGQNENPVDFIDCICTERHVAFAQENFYKYKKLEVTGPIRSGHYTDRDGKKVYTKTVLVETVEFAETKAEEVAYLKSIGKYQEPESEPEPESYDPGTLPPPAPEGAFMDIPDTIDAELPFR